MNHYAESRLRAPVPGRIHKKPHTHTHTHRDTHTHTRARARIHTHNHLLHWLTCLGPFSGTVHFVYFVAFPTKFLTFVSSSPLELVSFFFFPYDLCRCINDGRSRRSRWAVRQSAAGHPPCSDSPLLIGSSRQGQTRTRLQPWQLPAFARRP